MAYPAQSPMQQKLDYNLGEPNQLPQPWKHGLFDCFGDCGLCCQTWCCPCVTYGQTKEKLLGDGSCFSQGAIYCLVGSFTGLSFILGFMNRGEMRARFGIAGDSCGDVLTHCCCGCCALIQENREVNARMNQNHEVNAGMQ
ncbi:PLAC8 family-domain-containing protein [Jimgerdemannia flammicorona]|uniref:PLAC8 family-domain-containing protein n=2 Tax=Jimgerdemannia flammicorona TaxID=994334 RepID=A0A433CZE8_9FUNG|nr:PLAC8 family-domain-containing protein [Jimgerdemannia flammicorona]